LDTVATPITAPKNVSFKLEFPRGTAFASITVGYEYGFRRNRWKAFLTTDEPTFYTIPYCYYGGASANTLKLYFLTNPDSGNWTAIPASITIIANAPALEVLSFGTVYNPNKRTIYQSSGAALTFLQSVALTATSSQIVIGSSPYDNVADNCESSFEAGPGYQQVLAPSCDLGVCYSTISPNGKFYVSTEANEFSVTVRSPMTINAGADMILDDTNATALVGPVGGAYPITVRITLLVDVVRLNMQTLYPCGDEYCTQQYDQAYTAGSVFTCNLICEG
jgi:hypothetical protein